MNDHPHPLLLADALWAQAPPQRSKLTKWQASSIEAYAEIEGVWVNECVRSGQYMGRYYRIHDEMLDLARAISPGSVIWRGGHWEGDAETPGNEAAAPCWLSCTLKREIARHFVDKGGYNSDSADHQRLMRITCHEGVQALAAGRILHETGHRASLSEQEIMLLPHTILRLDRIMPSGILHISAYPGVQPARLWRGGADAEAA